MTRTGLDVRASEGSLRPYGGDVGAGVDMTPARPEDNAGG